jgi:hypothetical protein
VALKVEKTHGEAIFAEWTNANTIRLQDAVVARSWKNADTKKAAYDMARTLDVMADSGLDVTKEPAAEVGLRSLAAAWFMDRHPKDSDVGEWLKESSMSHFGVPRELYVEARMMRKLVGQATATTE